MTERAAERKLYIKEKTRHASIIMNKSTIFVDKKLSYRKAIRTTTSGSAE